MSELLPGTVVANRYVVDGVLGSGAAAVVYRVQDQKTGTTFALRLVGGQSAPVLQRLQADWRRLIKMSHKNLASVTEVVAMNGAAGVVVEFIEGPSLGALLERRTLTLEQGDFLAQGIMDGLIAAHSAGFYHRHLKPENILLELQPDTLVPKVTDFGWADVESRGWVIRGVPSYMVPEHGGDPSKLDARADVWVMGALLYKMVTNKEAFGGKDEFDVLRRIDAGEFVSPRRWVPSMPERMERAICGALVPDLARRFQSMQMLADVWMGKKGTKNSHKKPRVVSGVAGRPPQRPLAGLAVSVRDTWLSMDRERAADEEDDRLATIELANSLEMSVKPLPLREIRPETTQYEGEETVLFRIRREYGIVVALGAVVLTALAIMAVGLALLSIGFWLLEPVSSPGPSIHEAIGSSR